MNEVAEILKEFNYEIVLFENMSFEEQVKLANASQVIISLHGAGLTNTMFMQNDGYILELKMESDTTNHCYFSLASAVGVNYLYQYSAPTQQGLDVQNSDIKVDARKLRENILLIENAIQKKKTVN
jgi:capsular polysaccharide biosynthesis protein